MHVIRIDQKLLTQQAEALAEVQACLNMKNIPGTEDCENWVDAIEGVLSLLDQLQGDGIFVSV